MSEEPSTPSWLPGLGVDFIHRVYRTSIVVGLLVGALLWERFKMAAGLGWLLGVGLSLAVLRSAEWSVRRFLRPEEQSVGRMMAVTAAKMATVFLLLILTFVGATRGWVNPVAMAAGFPLPGLVLGLKLIGQKLVEISGAERPKG